MNQLSREPLIEDQAVIVLVETILVHAHEGEELRVDHFLCLKNSNFIWKNLSQISSHFLRLLVQRKKHFRFQIKHILPNIHILGKNLLLQCPLGQA